MNVDSLKTIKRPMLDVQFEYLFNMRQCTLFYQLMFHRHLRRRYPYHTTGDAIHAVYEVLAYKNKTEPIESYYWKTLHEYSSR